MTDQADLTHYGTKVDEQTAALRDALARSDYEAALALAKDVSSLCLLLAKATERVAEEDES